MTAYHIINQAFRVNGFVHLVLTRNGENIAAVPRGTAFIAPIVSTCQKCGGPEVVRVGSRGPFVGCAAFPDCQGNARNAKLSDFETLDRIYAEIAYPQVKTVLQDARLSTALSADLYNALVDYRKGNISFKEETPMALNPNTVTATVGNKGIKSGAATTAEIVKTAFVNAGAAVLAAKAAEGMVALARTHMGEHWPAALDTPVGRKLAEVVVPVAVLFLCESFGQSIPLASSAQHIATLAIQGTSQQTISEAVAAFTPFLKDLALLAGEAQKQIPGGE